MRYAHRKVCVCFLFVFFTVFGDDTLKNTVQDILDVIGSNATKAQCVGVCPMASRQAHVPEFLISFCEPLCGL